MLTYDVKEVMRENALSLVEVMLLEGVPFRIVLWNNDNWDMPLPEKIMQAFPTQLVLDIKEAALDESFVDEKTGEVIITTVFEGNEYSKVLHYGEIIAVLDLDGQPYVLNNFAQEPLEATVTDVMKELMPSTVNELVSIAVSEGISEEGARRSINCFLENNPDLKEKFDA